MWGLVASGRKEGERGNARAGWPIGPEWGTGWAARPTGWFPLFFQIIFFKAFSKESFEGN